MLRDVQKHPEALAIDFISRKWNSGHSTLWSMAIRKTKKILFFPILTKTNLLSSRMVQRPRPGLARLLLARRTLPRACASSTGAKMSSSASRKVSRCMGANT